MTAPFLPGSYVTVAEYKAQPTGLRLNNLVPGGTQAEQDAELARLIADASAYLDNVANQPLHATTTTLAGRAKVDADGLLVLHAQQDRVKTLDALAWGPVPQQVNTVTVPQQPWIEENRLRVPLTGGSFVGGLSGLATPRPGRVYVRWTYTAGWVTTVLATDAAAGVSTVTVADAAGIVAGDVLRLTDGATVQQVTVTSVSGATVTLDTATTQAFPAGSGLSEVPGDMREATTLATSHFVKQRKGTGVLMQKQQSSSTKATQQEIGQELTQAECIAAKYERKTP